jgi:hypothetical protein
MVKMTNPITNLRESLEEAMAMIDNSLLLPSEDKLYLENLHPLAQRLDFSDATSLLDKCDNVEEQYQSTRPVIRLIHHFACSGGTLVSKCLSAMPNVFLLSEVHPYSDLQRDRQTPEYSPSDIAKLAIYANIPEQKKLADEIFVASVKASYKHIIERGGILILRDHTHSDYCVGDVVYNNTITNVLNEHFQINSLVTLRNPIDSYLSLVASDWVHFIPANFDEYCSRLIVFLQPFKTEQIMFYEDFVQKPQQVIAQICSTLQLPFDDTFEDIYETFFVTGDSGRKGSQIDKRPRRECSDEFMLEIKNSKHFKILNKIYGFK